MICIVKKPSVQYKDYGFGQLEKQLKYRSTEVIEIENLYKLNNQKAPFITQEGLHYIKRDICESLTLRKYISNMLYIDLYSPKSQCIVSFIELKNKSEFKDLLHYKELFSSYLYTLYYYSGNKSYLRFIDNIEKIKRFGKTINVS